MPRLIPATGLLLALALLAAGCSRYQLGTGSRPAFASLGVEPVVNRSTLPQAEALVSARLREAFLRDGRVPTVTSGAAAVLSVTLEDFRREVAAVREGDTGLARKFNLTLSASATLRDGYQSSLTTYSGNRSRPAIDDPAIAVPRATMPVQTA